MASPENRDCQSRWVAVLVHAHRLTSRGAAMYRRQRKFLAGRSDCIVIFTASWCYRSWDAPRCSRPVRRSCSRVAALSIFRPCPRNQCPPAPHTIVFDGTEETCTGYSGRHLHYHGPVLLDRVETHAFENRRSSRVDDPLLPPATVRFAESESVANLLSKEFSRWREQVGARIIPRFWRVTPKFRVSSARALRLCAMHSRQISHGDTNWEGPVACTSEGRRSSTSGVV